LVLFLLGRLHTGRRNLLLQAPLTLALAAAMPLPTSAQAVSAPTPAITAPSPAVSPTLAPLIAQQSGPVTPPDTTSQFDLTPGHIPERAQAFENYQNFKVNALYKLPAKMFFNLNTENTLRLETNDLQTHNRNHANMVYRVLPNITLGYAFTRQTRISANYFFFRDQYMDQSALLSRNIHSVQLKGEHDFYLGRRAVLTTGLAGRELFLTHTSFPFFDLLPSMQVVSRVGERGAVYSGVIGQLRWTDMFNNFQEGDPFYSIGGVYRLPKWTFSADTTMIDSFGKAHLRGGVANSHVIVMTLEAARKVSQRLPLTVFVRAQPIFNYGQQKREGYAGVNVRIYGGVRMELNKPPIFPVKIGSG
jgi:hypothetical protein